MFQRQCIRVLPIGGLREKLLAAHRGLIRTALIPSENEKDLKDVPEAILKDMEIIRVESMDDVLSKGRGICFDYAALLACMLRTQGVPVKLVIGYADQSYHAWNNVLVDGQWYRVDTTAEANGMKVAKYTEERVY